MPDTDPPDNWYVYVLECADDTLYTGITTDLDRRVHEHNESPKGARYTRSRRPVDLVAAWSCADQSEAASDEAAFKSLSRDEKLRRVAVGSTPHAFESVADAYADALPAGDPSPYDFQPLRLVENDRLDAALLLSDAVDEIRDAFVDGAPALDEPAPDPVFFDGPGSYDGHALIVDGSPVVFFDAALLRDHVDHPDYAPRVHAAHEWAHGLHYANTPAFAPGRRDALNGDDSEYSVPLFRELVAEGLACYASSVVTGCDRRLATWFGLLDADRFAEWRDRARSRRSDSDADLVDLHAGADRVNRQRRRLFGLDGAPVDSRHGYWYGLEVAERAARDAEDFADLFGADLDEWSPHLRARLPTE